MSGPSDPAGGGGRPAPGAVLFARYAYPPNQLGYCGPGDGRELLDLASAYGSKGGGSSPGAGAGSGGEADITARARAFDGAWPYLEIIASSAGIGDPLDRRVVEAYWVGNELLDAVDPAVFARAARRCFGGQAGADWAGIEGSLPDTSAVPAAPHHSFHVFAIYPWMGLLRTGRPGPALTVLDQCRIRWGQVIATHDDQADVAGPRLTWDGRAVGLGEPTVQTLRWADGGRSLSAPPAPGEWVSLHWDWVCDRLTPAQLDALQRFTLRQLDITNRVAVSR